MQTAAVTNVMNYYVGSIKSYFKVMYAYLMRTNPLQNMVVNLEKSIKDILTANKKLRIAKYRVNHLRYRLYQMEKLIQENNPNSYANGKSINQLR